MQVVVSTSVPGLEIAFLNLFNLPSFALRNTVRGPMSTPRWVTTICDENMAPKWTTPFCDIANQVFIRTMIVIIVWFFYPAKIVEANDDDYHRSNSSQSGIDCTVHLIKHDYAPISI